jgi:hypothetical protein
MRIGIDFDNTIVCYDPLIYEIAVEKNLVPVTLGRTKQDVRDYLRDKGQEAEWTKLQGEIYGSRIQAATPFPGVVEFIELVRAYHDVLIVSHKTRFPYDGEKVDLHAAARTWLESQAFWNDLGRNAVHFELTLEEKLARIGQSECDVFIDDLPEVLNHPHFPEGVGKFLFDPQNAYGGDRAYTRVGNWSELAEKFIDGSFGT